MRSLWSGSLSFGLINIPVKLYTASRERGLNLDLLEKHTHHRIGYAKVDQETQERVDQRNIVKGFKYKEGDYVVITDDDFKRAHVRKNSSIDIVSFSDEDDIDTKYFEKPYYLEPDEKATKAYVLLREALKKTGKVGIAKFVMRGKEYLAAIKPDDNALILNQLRFDEEIVRPVTLDIPKSGKFTQRELEVAMSLIDYQTEKFDPEEFKDTYTRELKRVIREKAKGKKPKPKGQEPEPTEVADLMTVLKESLEKYDIKKRARK